MVGFLWTIPSKVKKALTSSVQKTKQRLVGAVGYACSWGRQHVYTLLLRGLKWHVLVPKKLRLFWHYVNYGVVSLAGLVLAAALLHSAAQGALQQFQNYHDVFIAAGGLIGTMLALMFSLSIIPVQRAVETFTGSIARLYREDRATQFIFVLLAVLSLLSFVMAVNGIGGIQGATLFPAQIVILACALDLLRWHHWRVSQLLDPAEAIARLGRRIAKEIDWTQRIVSRSAYLEWHLQPAELKEKYSLSMIESRSYALLPNHHLPINGGTSELAEIALKAVARGETQTAGIALSALGDVASHYLDRRKGNLRLTPSPGTLFLVTESDAKAVLTPIYERLKDIHQNAVAIKAATICIQVIRILGSIASYTASLQAEAFPIYEAPLTPMPMYYLRECVALAQRHELHDAGLEGSDALLHIARSAPDNVQIVHVHTPVIDGCFDIALAFLRSRTPTTGALVNEPLKDIMALAHHLVERKHFQADNVLGHILGKLQRLAPLAIIHERAQGQLSIRIPLALPYDMRINIR